MIILRNTTDTIEVVLGGVVATLPLRAFASWRDTTTTTIQAGRNAADSNNTTPVTLVSAPAASTQRVIDYISVFNSDSAAATVTIRYNANGTLYNLFVGTIGATERIEYQEGVGFKTMSASGAIRVTNNTGSVAADSSFSFVSKTVDQATSSTTFVDIASLSFSVIAEKIYWFRFVIPYTVNATTTGSRFAINGPASPLALQYMTDVTVTTGSKFVQRGLISYDATAASTTSATTGSNLAFIEGTIQPSSNGTLIARFSVESGSGGTVTQKEGAFVQYIEI